MGIVEFMRRRQQDRETRAETRSAEFLLREREAVAKQDRLRGELKARHAEAEARRLKTENFKAKYAPVTAAASGFMRGLSSLGSGGAGTAPKRKLKRRKGGFKNVDSLTNNSTLANNTAFKTRNIFYDK